MTYIYGHLEGVCLGVISISSRPLIVPVRLWHRHQHMHSVGDRQQHRHSRRCRRRASVVREPLTQGNLGLGRGSIGSATDSPHLHFVPGNKMPHASPVASRDLMGPMAAMEPSPPFLRRLPISVLFSAFVVFVVGNVVMAGVFLNDGGKRTLDVVLYSLTTEVHKCVVQYIDEVLHRAEQVAAVFPDAHACASVCHVARESVSWLR